MFLGWSLAPTELSSLPLSSSSKSYLSNEQVNYINLSLLYRGLSNFSSKLHIVFVYIVSNCYFSLQLFVLVSYIFNRTISLRNEARYNFFSQAMGRSWQLFYHYFIQQVLQEKASLVTIKKRYYKCHDCPPPDQVKVRTSATEKPC